ncbi:hypothetical protein [Bittarella massiliensis (ex Durand et al. 2017)]|uniref:hypothetical protein n=1 Tax=Bittarella massiliensis (ex Durand et al. 2017) TaxID=1720313 RepID=UPI00073F58EE|nr:hypothetical protein [Bittarella massiliensis (ex Durand et al. 2017)]
MNWLDKLERKAGRFCIPRLMWYLSGLMLVVFLIDLLLPQVGFSGYLVFDRALILQGQAWRLVSFLIVPQGNTVWILLSLYFYCVLSDGLEACWGSFKFNVFYLVGAVGAILSGMITGLGWSAYLNMSIFLAFALVYPEYEVNLFFLLPIKVKYLGFLGAFYYCIALIGGSWSTRLSIVMAFLNLILFFGGDFWGRIKSRWKYRESRRAFRQYQKNRQRGPWGQ